MMKCQVKLGWFVGLAWIETGLEGYAFGKPSGETYLHQAIVPAGTVTNKSPNHVVAMRNCSSATRCDSALNRLQTRCVEMALTRLSRSWNLNLTYRYLRQGRYRRKLRPARCKKDKLAAAALDGLCLGMPEWHTSIELR